MLLTIEDEATAARDPADETQEIDCPPVTRPEDDDGEYDDDRRRAALLLTAEQWQQHDYLTNYSIPVTPVGEGCGWTHFEPDDWLWSGWRLSDVADCCGLTIRPSPVLGGTFLIFDLTPALTGA